MPKSWIQNSDFVRIPVRFFSFLNCLNASRGTPCQVMDLKIRFRSAFFSELLNASKGAPCQSHGSKTQIFFAFHFLFFSFLNCLNASRGTPCQSHGSQNQISFGVFFLMCSMHPRELHAKVMDHEIRFFSYSI